MIWEVKYRAATEHIRFNPGRASPYCFTHSERSIALVVQGDDLTAMGLEADLDWYETDRAKSFERKIRGLVAKNCSLNEMRILNRIVTITTTGVHYESDPRHSKLMVQNPGLTDSKGVGTPGI